MVTKISKWSRIQDSFRITLKIESLVVCATPEGATKHRTGLTGRKLPHPNPNPNPNPSAAAAMLEVVVLNAGVVISSLVIHGSDFRYVDWKA